jgi:gliding motility-associated lipoprotein GldH
MNKLLPILLLILFSLPSCKPRTIYEKHQDIEGLRWNRFDVRTFEVEIKDISIKYDFFIALRHHTDVPFNYITVNFTIYTPDGETRIMDHKIMLRDRDGKLLGDGMGDLWDIEYPAWKGLKFTEPGICKVEISSTMSNADLPGILQVGLVVRQTK